MSLRKGLLFAMLLAIVALAEPGRVNVDKAEFDVPKPNPLLRAPAPATAALPWYDSWPANKPSRRLKTFRWKGELLPASFPPIQFKNPKDLGVGKLLVASRGLADPHFAGTVILLVHYDENGVVGLFLNRRTNVPLSQVLDLKAARDRSDPVYIGGPMEPFGCICTFSVPRAQLHLGPQLTLRPSGISQVNVKNVWVRPGRNCFFEEAFVGDQINTTEEVLSLFNLGQGFVFPADTAAIFNSDPDSLWLQMIKKTELRLAKTGPFVEISRPAE